jgi:PAS domain-containing protein
MGDRAPVMIWAARPDTTLDYINNTCVEFTGLPVEKLLDEGWLVAVYPEDLDHCLRTYIPAFEARTPSRGLRRSRNASTQSRAGGGHEDG